MSTFVAEISCQDPADNYVIRVKADTEDEARVKIQGTIANTQSITMVRRVGRGRPAAGSIILE